MSFGGVGGGGGAKEIGQVTGGMQMMSFDERTRPFTRGDMVNFIMNYQTNCNDKEKKLIHDSMLAGLSIPLAGFIGYRLSNRLPYKSIAKMMPINVFKPVARFSFTVSAMSIPIILIQQWVVSTILEMDDKDSMLAFHTKRFMIMQRGSMMFQRTATREVTLEEQQRLSQQAAEFRTTRTAGLPSHQGSDINVNLALTQQVLTPIAQTGYKPMQK